MAKMGQSAAKGAKKGQKGQKRWVIVAYCLSLMIFNTLKNK